jgi:outer membrane receptor protein involved in Fe transport
MKNVSGVVPNFYMPDYGSRMTSTIYVRGLGARIDQPVVGLNVDNVPFMNKDNYDFELLDIERMEVLRGPQSTLYGRNTMGGLINIYTLSPMKYQGLRAMVEYGMGNSFKAGVSYYDRFNSRLAMSWSGYVALNDGFYTNEYNGTDCGAEKQGSLRWKTVWRAADRVNIENVAALSLTRQSGYPYASIDTDQINYNDTCFYRRTGVTDGLTVKWINDYFTLSGITSFQYLDDNMTLDQDFLPLEYFTLTQRRKELALTQDVVVRGSVGDYGWTVGAFGFYKNTDMSAPVTFKEYGIDQLIEKNRNEANPVYPIAWDDEAFVLGSEFEIIIRIPTHCVVTHHILIRFQNLSGIIHLSSPRCFREGRSIGIRQLIPIVPIVTTHVVEPKPIHITRIVYVHDG